MTGSGGTELAGFGKREEYVAARRKIEEAEECWQPEKMKQRNAQALGCSENPGAGGWRKPQLQEQGEGHRKSQNMVKILPQQGQAKPAHVALKIFLSSPKKWFE